MMINKCQFKVASEILEITQSGKVRGNNKIEMGFREQNFI